MKKKILLIDDVQETRELLRFALEGQGYEVDEAEDGLSGLQKAQREPFNLIITDLGMPGMDGFTLVKKLRESRPMDEVSIIVTTAFGKLRNLFDTGGEPLIQEFVEKPFMVDDLVEKVKKLLK